MSNFWKNALVRIAATMLVVGLPSLVTILATGSFGTAKDYYAAGALALSGVGSLLITLATRFTGDSDSGSFFK